MTQSAIEVQELVKRYPGDVLALNGVSLEVQPGEIFGFLGPTAPGRAPWSRSWPLSAFPPQGPLASRASTSPPRPWRCGASPGWRFRMWVSTHS
jgi:ABC-type histidine transport system ATPase subunit